MHLSRSETARFRLGRPGYLAIKAGLLRLDHAGNSFELSATDLLRSWLPNEPDVEKLAWSFEEWVGGYACQESGFLADSDAMIRAVAQWQRMGMRRDCWTRIGPMLMEAAEQVKAEMERVRAMRV